ncbi:hypothetical protein Q9R19_02045 [Microbacterium sp. ARD32]|uniref:hypothetical protein n=1 Tax=Microbacterium sp. ARD32 TaxID=2962577 RepID=UPI002882620E|nr:hypothetical protein [Microbacterium sp. ARD32]MDT0156398.1 hypothetical protein [Microbacterium sp. ARD32]
METEGDRPSASAPDGADSASADPNISQSEQNDPAVALVPDVLFPGLSLTITAIEWERVWVSLTLEFSRPVSGDVDFVIYDTLRAFPVDAEQVDERTHRIRINVTNFRDRHQLPNGTWRFLAVIDGERGPLAGYPLARAGELAASGRSYLYNRNLSTYVITFGLSQDDRADVVMRSYQLNRPTPKPKSKGR